MKRTRWHAAEEADLVAGYVRAATTHGQATRSGDAKAGNAAAATISSIYRELRVRDRRSVLLPLTGHEDDGVRLWAAAHSLEFAPSDGELVLEELEGGVGPLAFSAEMTLRRWRSGQLRFPSEPRDGA